MSTTEQPSVASLLPAISAVGAVEGNSNSVPPTSTSTHSRIHSVIATSSRGSGGEGSNNSGMAAGSVDAGGFTAPETRTKTSVFLPRTFVRAAAAATAVTDEAAAAAPSSDAVGSSMLCSHGLTIMPSSTTGISLVRYRAKLEECARLHVELERTRELLQIAEQHIAGQRNEYGSSLEESLRLQDVLQTVTGELHGRQARVRELEQENAQLRCELAEIMRESGAAAPVASTISAQRATAATRVPSVTFVVNGTPTTAALASLPAHASQSPADQLLAQAQQQQQQQQQFDGQESYTSSTVATTTTAAYANESLNNIFGESTAATAIGFGPCGGNCDADALLHYTMESFRGGCAPHPQVLHSLYRNDGHLIMSEPPVSFAQLNVILRLMQAGGNVNKAAGAANNNNNGGVASSPLSSFATWAVQSITSLSIQCADAHSGIALLGHFIALLPGLSEVEVSSLRTTTAVRRLTEVLATATQVQVLSLPKLAVDDEALVHLWKLLAQREALALKEQQSRHSPQSFSQQAATMELYTAAATAQNAATRMGKWDDHAVMVGPPSPKATASGIAIQQQQQQQHNTGGNSKNEHFSAVAGHSTASTEHFLPSSPLSIHTIDLSACTVRDSLTLQKLCCPGLEVLLLMGTDTLTDANLRTILDHCPQLHTLDMSGCTRLTAACTRFFNAHPNVHVLRAENCPGIKSLDLAHVEVLYSSLAYVAELRMPNLLRLPVPITNRTVLRHFSAPRLEEIALHGMIIDAHTLQPALMLTDSQAKAVTASKAGRFDNAEPSKVDEEEDASKTPASSSSEDTAPVADTHSSIDQSNNSNRENALSFPPPQQLRLVSFTECTFTNADELASFLQQQQHILKLSLRSCRGVLDSHLQELHSQLLELDVANVGSLTDAGVRAIVVRSPQLMRLNLKACDGGGGDVTDGGIRALHGLSNLVELNLLGLSAKAVMGPVVAAVAASLSHLTRLYHENAVVVSGGASAPGRAIAHSGELLRVERQDEECQWTREMASAPEELLRLRTSASLALWLESKMPSPSKLLPVATARTVAASAYAASTALAYTPRPPQHQSSARSSHYAATQYQQKVNGNNVGDGSWRISPSQIARTYPGINHSAADTGAITGNYVSFFPGAAVAGTANTMQFNDSGIDVNEDDERCVPSCLTATVNLPVGVAAAAAAGVDAAVTESNDPYNVSPRPRNPHPQQQQSLRVGNLNDPEGNSDSLESSVASSDTYASQDEEERAARSGRGSVGENHGRSSANRIDSALAAATQRLVENEQLGPWGEEDAMTEHQHEAMRQQQQQRSRTPSRSSGRPPLPSSFPPR